MALSPGTRLGPYEILSPLGAGGMGEVYRAKDHKLGRQVAIKVLPDDLSGDRERLQRFEREARAASSLNHPNTVTIHDVDEADGTHYIAMELVEGQTLRERLAGGRLPPDEMLRIATQVAQGLAKAHAAGIVHRDLKPGNIMITDEGLVKILDFGLAKLTSVGVEEVSALTTVPEVTRTGVVLGTVPYMSPEQASGRPVDFRSDQFSFGSILYEMATGRRAFEGDSAPQTLAAILEASPPPVAVLNDRVPGPVVRLIERCLSRDPGGRYDSTGDLAKELARGGPADSESRGSREWWPVAGVAALAVVVVGVLYWSVSGPGATRSGEGPMSPLVAVPLTTYPGEEAEPVFSPDGSQVAFSWNGPDGDNRDIYVKAIGSEQPLRLTSDPAPDGSPAWAPDGRSIAFLRALGSGSSEVLLVPPTGGPERRLGSIDSASQDGLSWSPDGRSLACVDRPSSSDPSGLFLLDAESGAKARLTSTPPTGEHGDTRPVFSPDGGSLAFRRGQQGIHLLPARGGVPRFLTFGRRVTWTPEGRELLFTAVPSDDDGERPTPSSGYSGARALWRISVEGGPAQQLPGPIDPQDLAVSVEGNRLAYVQRSRSSDIWRIDLRPSELSGEAQAPVIASTKVDGNPHFSSDGEHVAFSSARSGHMEIWVADRDGGSLLQVTSLGDVGEAGSPRWSPDAASIAFDFNPHSVGADVDIYAVDASGGGLRQVTSGTPLDYTPSWSRDGRWIYFSSDRGTGWQVWKVPSEGESGDNVRQVTRGGGFRPIESADGRHVYFARWRSGREDPANAIWRVPVQGGAEEEVVESIPSSHGNWDVTGEGVYYLDRDAATAGEPWVIKRLDLESRSVDVASRLTYPLTDPPNLGAPGFSVSSDGRWALLWHHRATLDLMLVENFR